MPIPAVSVEVAFTTPPFSATPAWTDVTAWVQTVGVGGPIGISVGRQDELGEAQPSRLTLTLDNADGRFTPGRAASPYFPNVKDGRRIRVRVTYNAVTYTRFDGYVDEWPMQWQNGVLSYVTLTATDRFKPLGQNRRPLRSAFEEEVLLLKPRFYYVLGEAAGATAAADTSDVGGRPLPIAQVGTGGSVTFGAGTGVGVEPLPAPLFAPVNVDNGKLLLGPPAAAAVGPSGATIRRYAIGAAFRTGTAAVQDIVVLSGTDGSVAVNVDATGAVNIAYRSSAGRDQLDATSGGTYANNATHYVFAVVDMSFSAGVWTVNNLALTIDGLDVTFWTPTALVDPPVSQFTQVGIGGRSTGRLFSGTISHVAMFDAAVYEWALTNSGSPWNGLLGWNHATSDKQLERVLYYGGLVPSGIGSVVEQNLEAGRSTMGPLKVNGKDALSAAREIVATEQGVLFVNPADAKATSHGRAHRVNQSPAYSLDASQGYVGQDVTLALNDQFRRNDVSTRREGGGVFRVVNAASVDAYGTYRDDLTLLCDTDSEAQQAGMSLVNTYGEYGPRWPALPLDLLGSGDVAVGTSTLAAVVLGTALGDKITVAGLPAEAPAASVNLNVEGWTEDMGVDSWRVVLATSPDLNLRAWVLGSASFSQLGISTVLGLY